MSIQSFRRAVRCVAVVALVWAVQGVRQGVARAKDHPHVDRPVCVAVASLPSQNVAANQFAVAGGDNGGGNKKVTRWRLDTVQDAGTYNKKHTNKVSYVSVWLDTANVNNSKLLQASYDGDVAVSKIDPGAADPILSRFKHTKPAGATADVEVWVVAPSLDGTLALSATNFGEIKVWNAALPPNSPPNTLAPARGTRVGKTSFDPVAGLVSIPAGTSGNRRFVAAHFDGKARVYELKANGGGFDLVNTFTFDMGNDAAVNCVAVRTTGDRLVTSGFDSTVRVWDLTASNAVAPTTPGIPQIATPAQAIAQITAHDDIVWRVAVSPDGQMIASASEDATVRLFRMNGNPVPDPDHCNADAVTTEVDDADPTIERGVMGVAFVTNDKLVYTVGKDKPGNQQQDVRVWDLTHINHP